MYLYLANPGEETITVTLLPPQGTEMRLRIPVEEVALPWPVKVPAGKTVQLALQPPVPAEGQECLASQFFDLYFTTDGPVGVLASVVDRAANDARTVLVTSRWRLVP